jgi:hypothetical protein
MELVRQFAPDDEEVAIDSIGLEPILARNAVRNAG